MATSGTIAKIGLHLAKKDAFAPYVRECLAQYGLVHEVLPEIPADLTDYAVLVLAGRGELSAKQIESVGGWVLRGGRVLFVGGTWAMEHHMGILPFDHLYPGRSRLKMTPSGEPIWPAEAEDIPFFGGVVAMPKQCDTLATLGDIHVGIGRRHMMNGVLTLFAPDLGQSIARIQMGHSVEHDGIGPNDGSAFLADGVARSEDGSNLRFDQDRSQPDPDFHRIFNQPHADILKEVFIKLLLLEIHETGKHALMLWQWPENADSVAMLNVEVEDTDGDNAFRLKQVMDVSNIPATWYVSAPGYSLDTYRMIRRWGDEIGLLFHPGENGWSVERMRSQYLMLSRTASVSQLIAARPIDGRWFGYSVFYDMCESAGARISTSKGGRQRGTMGFLYGTCRPFHPLKGDGSSYLTMEIPNIIYQPGDLASTKVMHALVRQTALRHGCLTASISSTFNTEHDGMLALKQLFLLAQQYRSLWVLPEEIANFEKARRHVRVVGIRGRNAELTAEHPVEGLTIMVSNDPEGMLLNSRLVDRQTVNRYGTNWATMRVDISPRQRVELRVGDLEPAA
ncbi:MAG: hypothetical protein JST40_00480 [Armatimonadetes bacterium]|nr:hypothetical protein [Armatimonadota bacterium]